LVPKWDRGNSGTGVLVRTVDLGTYRRETFLANDKCMANLLVINYKYSIPFIITFSTFIYSSYEYFDDG